MRSKFKFISLTVFLFTQVVNAQTSEYSIQLNSGLFSFMGSGAESKTSINYSLDKDWGYTNNPYGSLFAPGIGLALSANRITASNLRIGIDAGMEYMQSRTQIDHIYTLEVIPTKGSSYFVFHFVQITGKLGYRIPLKNMSIDIDAIFETSMAMKSYDKAEVKGNDGKTYSINRDRDYDIMDYRPGLRASLNYKKYNFNIGYSQGISNYVEDMLCGGNHKVYSRIIRFGVGYRLNH